MKKHTNLPWEKRGFALYVPGTNKKIVEASLAWRSSEETQANIDLVQHRMNCHDDMLAMLKECVDLFDDGYDRKRVSDIIAKAEGAK